MLNDTDDAGRGLPDPSNSPAPVEPAAPGDAGAPQPTGKGRTWLREIATTLVEAAALYLLLAMMFGRFEIKQVSMEPTFHEGQYVLVNRLGTWADWALARGGDALQALGAQPAYATDGSPIAPRFGPSRGQVVVLYRQGYGEDALIKRVIGLPGELIEVRGGAVWINGEVLSEPYLNGVTTERCDRVCSITLGVNQYFVMGDNRPSSNDSRSFGPITADQIVGEVVLRYLPLDKIAFFP